MFEGIHSSMYEPVSDFGARRVLGMGGSLSGYIQTGNAYDKRYYNNQTKPDTFEKRKIPKRRIIDNIITAAVLAGSAAVGGYLLFKKGVGKSLNLEKLKDNLPDLSKINPKETISKINLKETISKIPENIRNGITNLKDKLTKKN